MISQTIDASRSFPISTLAAIALTAQNSASRLPRINICSEMKGHAFMVLALAFAVCRVDGLYTHKCKEAETSPDKLTRIMENVNCTLIGGGKRVHETVNHLKLTVLHGFDHFRNKFTRPTTKRPGYEGLDDAIDVRMMSEDDQQPVTSRPKRETTAEEIQGELEKAVERCQCIICN